MRQQKIPKSLLLKYEVKESMMRHKSVLHGPAHMMRVFILQELICQQLEKEGVQINREATRWAASVHDIGRKEDSQIQKIQSRKTLKISHLG